MVLLLTSSRPSLPHDPSPQENTWFLSVDARLCLRSRTDHHQPPGTDSGRGKTGADEPGASCDVSHRVSGERFDQCWVVQLASAAVPELTVLACAHAHDDTLVLILRIKRIRFYAPSPQE